MKPEVILANFFLKTMQQVNSTFQQTLYCILYPLRMTEVRPFIACALFLLTIKKVFSDYQGKTIHLRDGFVPKRVLYVNKLEINDAEEKMS